MRNFIISLLLLFSVLPSTAQSDSLGEVRIEKTNINYKSFVISDNKLFAINDSGNIIIWDLNKLDTIYFTHNEKAFHYTAICKDRNNQIFIGTSKGDVFKLNPSNLSYSLFLHDKYYVYSICFNSLNKMFLVVPYAVYEPISKKYWVKFENHASGIIRWKKVFGIFKKHTNQSFTLPQFSYLDRRDRWWMCSSYGEFGGETEIFDTKNKKIYDNKFEGINTGLLFPKSVFDGNYGSIYITSGLQHFESSGEIYKIDSNRIVTKIYNSDDYRDTTKGRFEDDGVFVGPGVYNKTDNSIYFASNKGFYKATMPSTGKIQNLHLLFKPKLRWEREPHAIGVGMTVKSIEFSDDNKLIFLTSNDGIGIYNNEKLIFLK